MNVLAGATGSSVGTVELAADHTADLRGVAAAAVSDVQFSGSTIRVERKVVTPVPKVAGGSTGQAEFSTTYHIDTSIR